LELGFIDFKGEFTIISDSAGALFVCDKPNMASKSPIRNRLMRKMINMLWGRTYRISLLWVKSEDNSADEMSRATNIITGHWSIINNSTNCMNKDNWFDCMQFLSRFGNKKPDRGDKKGICNQGEHIPYILQNLEHPPMAQSECGGIYFHGF
jgi:hypothetical protein